MHISIFVVAVIACVKRAKSSVAQNESKKKHTHTHTNRLAHMWIAFYHIRISKNVQQTEMENGSICSCCHSQWQHSPHFLSVLRCYFLINFICTLSNLLCLVSLGFVRLSFSLFLYLFSLYLCPNERISCGAVSFCLGCCFYDAW